MDMPLAGCTQQLYAICMKPMVEKMEAMWNCICEYTGVAGPSPSPLALSPRAIREVLFRALWGLDRAAYNDSMTKPYYGAVATVLTPLFPTLEKVVYDRMFGDVEGRTNSLRNR